MVSFIIGNECWASARFANCITSYEISAATDVDSRSNPLALSMQTAKACTRKLDLMEFLCSRMYTVRTHCIRHFNRNILSSLIALRADGATTAHWQHSELIDFCANLHVCVSVREIGVATNFANRVDATWETYRNIFSSYNVHVRHKLIR